MNELVFSVGGARMPCIGLEWLGGWTGVPYNGRHVQISGIHRIDGRRMGRGWGRVNHPETDNVSINPASPAQKCHLLLRDADESAEGSEGTNGAET